MTTMHASTLCRRELGLFEGTILHWYRDATGTWTCCTGHTAAAGPPVYVAGKTFTAAEADRLLAFCESCSRALDLGGRVHHETHRSRILYSPWVTRDVCARHAKLTLVADYSHFTCVAEARPTDPELDACVRALNARVRHVHARVGFEGELCKCRFSLSLSLDLSNVSLTHTLSIYLSLYVSPSRAMYPSMYLLVSLYAILSLSR